MKSEMEESLPDQPPVSTTSPTPTFLTSSLSDSLEAALEARPLASAIKKARPQQKIGRHGPAKLSTTSSIPVCKPTVPIFLLAGGSLRLLPRPPILVTVLIRPHMSLQLCLDKCAWF